MSHDPRPLAAEPVAFLCSPAGGWVNGQVATSDGGSSLRL